METAFYMMKGPKQRDLLTRYLMRCLRRLMATIDRLNSRYSRNTARCEIPVPTDHGDRKKRGSYKDRRG